MKSSSENIAAHLLHAAANTEQPRFIKRSMAWVRLKQKHPTETLNHPLLRLFSSKPHGVRVPAGCASISCSRVPPRFQSSGARFIKRVAIYIFISDRRQTLFHGCTLYRFMFI